jgi:hypothetical protein
MIFTVTQKILETKWISLRKEVGKKSAKYNRLTSSQWGLAYIHVLELGWPRNGYLAISRNTKLDEIKQFFRGISRNSTPIYTLSCATETGWPPPACLAGIGVGGAGGGLIHPFLHPLLRHWGWMTATCVHFYILAHFLFNSSGGFSVHPQALLGSTYLCCPRYLRALPPSAPAGGWGGGELPDFHAPILGQVFFQIIWTK